MKKATDYIVNPDDTLKSLKPVQTIEIASVRLVSKQRHGYNYTKKEKKEKENRYISNSVRRAMRSMCKNTRYP